MIFRENGYAYSEATAKQLLLNCGFDAFDIEELSTLIAGDKIAKLEQEAHGGDDYERIADAYHWQIDDAVCMIDEFLEAECITKPREKLEALKNTLEIY